MYKSHDPDYPHLEIASDHPLFEGVNIAVKVFSQLLASKIEEYRMISEATGNVLEAFELQYVTHFPQLLNDHIEWEERNKSDPALINQLATLKKSQ